MTVNYNTYHFDNVERKDSWTMPIDFSILNFGYTFNNQTFGNKETYSYIVFNGRYGEFLKEDLSGNVITFNNKDVKTDYRLINFIDLTRDQKYKSDELIKKEFDKAYNTNHVLVQTSIEGHEYVYALEKL